jgi:glyoxylase I family protein
MRELRFFRCKNGPNFEIFQWESPDGQAPQPKNSDIGGHHLAFYVDDIDEALAYLRTQNVTILGGIVASQNASLGQRWVYFLTPWGMQCELVSFPAGKAYESTASTMLWHPARPAE